MKNLTIKLLITALISSFLVIGAGAYYLVRITHQSDRIIMEKVENTEGDSAADGNDSIYSEPAPVIEEIIPSAAFIGDEVVIKGKNLSGFEGDLSVTFEKSNGQKTTILAKNSLDSEKIIFDLKEPCQQGEVIYDGYSDIPRECKYVQLNPGTYKVYTEPWGQKSNVFNFEILQPTIEQTSRRDEIDFETGKPVGYTSSPYSNIIGHDTSIGITFSIPAGVVASSVLDESLQEVKAFRFEDGLSGKYNDTFVIFSCFEAGIPKIAETISFVDFSQDRTDRNVDINNILYRLTQYENFFLLSDVEYVGPVGPGWDIFGCGIYIVGRDFSEVATSFLKELNYIDGRDQYLKNLYERFVIKYGGN